jgi:hypothetical protein
MDAANTSEGHSSAPESATPQPNSGARKIIGRPFPKGTSGNPNGRPQIERRVRRYARKYDRKMCKVLATLAQDEKVPPSERRRAAMDLIAVGSGRPALVQEVSGQGGAPLGPLVNFNFAGGGMSAFDAHKVLLENPGLSDAEQQTFIDYLRNGVRRTTLAADAIDVQAEPSPQDPL